MNTHTQCVWSTGLWHVHAPASSTISLRISGCVCVRVHRICMVCIQIVYDILGTSIRHNVRSLVHSFVLLLLLSLSLSSVDVRAFNVSKTYAQFIHMHKSLEPKWALWTVSRVFLSTTPLLLSFLLYSTIACKLMCSAHTPFKHQYARTHTHKQHIHVQRAEQSRVENRFSV